VPFEGNDRPGVMSARAGCRLLAHGVTVGPRVAVVTVEGGSPFGQAYVDAEPGAYRIQGDPRRALAKSVVVDTGRGEESVPCDAVLIDAPLAPAYELCAQAGANLVHTGRGYRVSPAPGGQIRPGVFATGEAVGTALDPRAITAEASRLDPSR
jgi:hypothetical protein